MSSTSNIRSSIIFPSCVILLSTFDSFSTILLLSNCHSCPRLESGMGVTLEDEPPRLAEISRAIQDFRNEFREAMKGMVRRDVYDANMQMIQLQINNSDAKTITSHKELDAKIVTLQMERLEDEKARR